MCECHYMQSSQYVPWMTPSPPYDYYAPANFGFYQEPFTISTSREIRNKAEKQRRDKLNQCINELATLVPMVSSSTKRLDKTSILRLSATFLRMHQVLLKKEGKTDDLKVPNALCQSLLEEMDGILLVVTASGKIVFVTHNVENLIGHPQTDLLGQSLFNITSLEDHDVLKAAFTPDSSLDHPSASSDFERQPERRSFYLRLRLKTVSKSDHPQYELVHVMGHLRVPPAASRTKTKGESHVANEVVLVAMMKPFKEKRVSENSLIEATKEEWVSRHLIDGTIVYSDHRISTVSGYMSEEVSGSKGFQYMHSDDVRWVLIALRQMYYRGESYGSSCYRLLSKNGVYIYIRTYGYLELNEDTNQVESFICINTLVNADEGVSEIAKMRALYTPLIGKNDNFVTGIADSRHITEVPSTGSGSKLLQPLQVDDPNELNTAIDQLLSNLPSDHIQPTAKDPAPDVQFAKAALASKALPPVKIHTTKVGVTKLPKIKKAPRYIRQSVITRAKEKRDVGDDGAIVKRHKAESSVSVIRARVEYFPLDPTTSQNAVLEPNSPPLFPPPQESALPQGASHLVELQQLQIEQPQILQLEQPLQLENPQMIQLEELPVLQELEPQQIEHSQLQIIEQPIQPPPEPIFPNEIIDLDNIEEQAAFYVDPVGEEIPQPNRDIWDTDIHTMDHNIAQDHTRLEQNISFQGNQIRQIEENITCAQFTTNVDQDTQKTFNETFTELKKEHRIHEQLLQNLKQAHRTTQHLFPDQAENINA